MEESKGNAGRGCKVGGRAKAQDVSFDFDREVWRKMEEVERIHFECRERKS